MKIQLKNIGILTEADIDIDGITIIAGENNVGKSTVGKALFAFLQEMSSWKKMYDDICSSRVKNFLYEHSVALEDWCMKISGAKRRRTSRADLLQKNYSRDEDFLAAIEDFQVAEGETEKADARENVSKYFSRYCKEYVALYTWKDESQLNYDGVSMAEWKRTWLDGMLDSVRQLELDELKIQIRQITKSLQEVFNSQYRKVGSSESRIAFVDDLGRHVQFIIKEDGEILDQPLRVNNRIFFVESPKIYDYLSNPYFGRIQKEYLRYLMSPNVFKKGAQFFRVSDDEYEFKKIGNEKQVRGITDRLVKVMGGRAEFLQKVGLEFRDEHIAEPIHAVNVSTGLKSMALLEYALRIGAIEKGDILVLDEPEINLHPEWQVEYAKTLVNLQKEFCLRILVTTHSPYFMRAIECFTDMNESMEKLNVYRVSKDAKSGETKVENVSYSEYGMTDLYDDLSAPLEELESLIDEKYGTEE